MDSIINSRHVVWVNEVRAKRSKCGAANERWRFRHNVCVFGMEDLNRLRQRPELFANKFMPAFDYGALSCWLEHIYNRTHFGSRSPTLELDLDYYADLPHVRYHRMRETMMPGQKWNKYAFDCSTPHPKLIR